MKIPTIYLKKKITFEVRNSNFKVRILENIYNASAYHIIQKNKVKNSVKNCVKVVKSYNSENRYVGKLHSYKGGGTCQQRLCSIQKTNKKTIYAKGEKKNKTHIITRN